MPLYFTKPRRWPPSRPVQFLLAFLALLIALAVLTAWLCIRYMQSGIGNQPDESSAPSSIDLPPTEAANSLLIIDQKGSERFILIQADPAAGEMIAAAIPANLYTADDMTLAAILRKHGSPRAKQAVATALELPIKHYITLSAADAEAFLNHLDSGLIYQPPEAVSYVDENGGSAQIPAEKRKLTAGQVRALLQYTGWQTPQTGETVAADLTAALLCQYLVPERTFGGDFAALSNAAQTDLRIDHYNAYRSTLIYLAEQNDGTLCRRVTLAGSIGEDGFLPDLATIRRETGLYAE